MLPVPASPLVRIIAAPSLIRRSASPRFRQPHTNGHLEGVLVDVVALVGRGEDLGLVDVVDAERLEDLRLDEVADARLGHDRDRHRVHDPGDHLGVGHAGDAAGLADVGGHALERHHGDGAGVLGDLGLVGRDDVHDDAALEHLGEALLGRPGGGFDGHVGCGSSWFGFARRARRGVSRAVRIMSRGPRSGPTNVDDPARRCGRWTRMDRSRSRDGVLPRRSNVVRASCPWGTVRPARTPWPDVASSQQPPPWHPVIGRTPRSPACTWRSPPGCDRPSGFAGLTSSTARPSTMTISSAPLSTWIAICGFSRRLRCQRVGPPSTYQQAIDPGTPDRD